VSRIRERVSYANVVSSLALFIALGGTSYALTLPRNSVGSQQIRARAVGPTEIRKSAVRSSEVRDRSLGVRDLSLAARDSLRGTPGPAGPAGPSGVTYRAAVDSGGVPHRGNATSYTKPAINQYLVGFDRSVDDCVSTATLAIVEGGVTEDPPAGRITVARNAGRVLVKTFNAAGNPQALPFHLIVAC
jgi:hypothetical protein